MLKQSGIDRVSEDPLLGFDDHFVSDVATDARVNREHDKLIEDASRIIEEVYAGRE